MAMFSGSSSICSMVLGVTAVSITAALLGVSAVALSVRVLADTARTGDLRIVPPRARIWMAQVTPARPRLVELGLPEPMPDTLIPGSPPTALTIDEGLKPPILRTPGLLRLPGNARPKTIRTRWVDVDVRVDENGVVSDALWAGGSDDSTLARSATEGALSMRFYPAIKAGRPVAVWCRQRFEINGRY